MTLGLIIIVLGALLIIGNFMMKLGWKIRDGSLVLGELIIDHFSNSEKLRLRMEEFSRRKSFIGEGTFRKIVQFSIYMIGVFLIGIGIYYLFRKEWLINPWILLVAIAWIVLLALLPLIKGSRA